MSASRRPSMDDVARAAGVSKGAVSKVIRNAYGVSDAMRERVEAAIQELGYRPRLAARAMRGSSFSIGMEVPNLGNPFLTQVMQGAADGLAGSSFQLIVAPGLGEMRGAPVLENLADRSVDGIIAISPEVSPDWLEQLASEIPLVLVGRHDASLNYDTVTGDDRAGARLALAHLHELGHESIAHLTIPTDGVGSSNQTPHAVRLETYLEFMEEHDLPPTVVTCGRTEEDGYQSAVGMFEQSPGLTAVFAGHDALAIGVMRALAERGPAGADVSVVGYDDIDVSSHPFLSLTTVAQFGERMGSSAIELLMERINDERTSSRQLTIDTELRVRNSTRAAPGSLTRPGTAGCGTPAPSVPRPRT